MSAVKKLRHANLARTLRCVKCGEEFPHVHLNDDCLNCGGREWEKPSENKRHWARV